MTFKDPMALEILCLLLSLQALIVILYDTSLRSPSALDSLSIVVLCVAAALQALRTIWLRKVALGGGFDRASERVFSLCGAYLVMLWGVLNVAIVHVRPSQFVFIPVRLFWHSSITKLISLDEDNVPCWCRRRVADHITHGH